MKKYRGRIVLVSVLLIITCLLTNSIASEWEVVLPLRVDVARQGTFVGFQAGNVNTGGWNSFLGFQAGLSNTTGGNNTFIGRVAGQGNTTGSDNTFIGRSSGQSNTTGFRNTFVGSVTGVTNTTGFDNTFIGSDAGFFSGTGHSNVFVGMASGYLTGTGHSNTFIGSEAGYNNRAGFNNIFIGRNAGQSLADGTENMVSNNSVFVGINTRASAAGNTNEIVIGANTVGIGSNSVTLGNPSIARTVLRGNTTLGIAIPGAPTVTPHHGTGTTAWGYRITARDGAGETLASAEGRTMTGHAHIGSFTPFGMLIFNRITWSAVPGAVDYRIYRTTAGGTPSTIGLIGTTDRLVFDDAGLAATTPVPTIDTTAGVSIGTPTIPARGNKLEVHNGHIVNTMTTPPTVTSDVGIPSIIGTDMSGAITVPAGASSCTITFTIPWNQIYGCVVSSSASGAHPFVPALSNTSVTFNFTATPAAVTSLYYHCSGR